MSIFFSVKSKIFKIVWFNGTILLENGFSVKTYLLFSWQWTTMVRWSGFISSMSCNFRFQHHIHFFGSSWWSSIQCSSHHPHHGCIAIATTTTCSIGQSGKCKQYNKSDIFPWNQMVNKSISFRPTPYFIFRRQF